MKGNVPNLERASAGDMGMEMESASGSGAKLFEWDFTMAEDPRHLVASATAQGSFGPLGIRENCIRYP